MLGKIVFVPFYITKKSIVDLLQNMSLKP